MDNTKITLEEQTLIAARQQIWAASLSVAASIGGSPEEQARDALSIYKFSIDLARGYGDPLRAAL